MLIRRVALASAAFCALLPAYAHAAPVTLSEPVTPPLDGDGTGLCAATAESTSSNDVLPLLNEGSYNGSINGFMEAHKDDRIELVLRTLFDLSNNNEESARRPSYGDFTSLTPPNCGVGGCSFVTKDVMTQAYYDRPETAFASRFRGFFNVTDAFAAKPIHFGFYADDGVSLTFFDKNAGNTPVLTRYLEVGKPTWRITNTVTFEKPGLYPFEILYFEVAEHAALEMSYLIGSFQDFNSVPGTAGTPSLKDAGFTLFPPTTFFQTLSGVPSFPDLNQCRQCDRQFVNIAGNNGCDPGNYCNEAALCAPCDTAVFCGDTCSPCGGETPFCINVNGKRDCGQCRNSFDCKDGFSCDEATHTCQECNVDSDCPRANICMDHSCVPCETNDRCAGNSCNCCPQGSNGKPMECTKIGGEGSAVCVECTLDTDCSSGSKCDVLAGHCVDELWKNDRSDCCGEDCVKCPSDYPHCIPGPVGTACAECRNDMDCSEGNYCLSGECKACVKDRRCGLRCDSCGGDEPFCLGTQFADSAICVRCTSDAQCGDGSTCNPETHDCEPGCMATCAEDTPYCDGQRCVECYADTQCPCGNTCDLSTNTCDISCKTSADCLGNEHCRWADNADAKECALGPMPEDVACGGTLASACGAHIGRRGDDPPPAGLLALAMLALFGRRRAGARP
jgi:outer membrane exchange protein TraA